MAVYLNSFKLQHSNLLSNFTRKYLRSQIDNDDAGIPTSTSTVDSIPFPFLEWKCPILEGSKQTLC